ncbi:MAG: hypothetical protein AAGG46_11750, partial [Planctomycetota bacterium]
MPKLIAFLAVFAAAPSLALADHHSEGEAEAEAPVTIAVEAEHFLRQREVDKRRWFVTSADSVPDITPDGDPPHHETASSGAYIEILPDTRRTHDDKLVKYENISAEPGRMTIVDYEVAFPAPGRYYVWVRAFSTGSEDNGIHVGLNGEWPSSGERMQWCKGKQKWYWESKQRTKKQHCGVEHAIYLDVPSRGRHMVS